MPRFSPPTTPDPREFLGLVGPVLKATPPGNRRIHDQDEGLRPTRDDPQGSRFQNQGPLRNDVYFPAADPSYAGYGAYAALDGSRVDTAEFAEIDFPGPLVAADADEEEADGDRVVLQTDGEILAEVYGNIADDPYLHAAGLEVAVERGEVWLHGSVPSRERKRLAEDLAYRVPGVLDVHNRLRVAPPPTRTGRSS